MLEITVKLTFQTPVNVGSGAQQGTLAKRGMVKDRDGWPYIPASAFKGRLRHTVEQVVKTLPGDRRHCVTHQDMCREPEMACEVCQIFGSPWLAGSARFVDLALTGPEVVMGVKQKAKQPPRTNQRTGVAINRSRHVAEDAMLYTTELLFPGIDLEFTGSISGLATARQAALIVAGLRLVKTLGRGKSGGLGWLFSEAKVSEDGSIWTAETLQAALTGGRPGG